MKINALLLALFLLLFSCTKSNDVLENTCFTCSYSTDSKKITEEICDDTTNNEIEKIEMEERLQKEADALNVVLTCSE